MGEDRKNISLTIKTFLEAFKNNPNPPALILKTSLGNNSVIDYSEVKKRIYDIKKYVLSNTSRPPNVYLIHGELTDEEMNHLYNHPKVKAHINLTKGEGFGRPLLEASLSKKPIIASNWSGHLDFLRPKNTILVDGILTKVHPSAIREEGIMQEAQWFSFYYDKAKSAMKDVFKNYKKYKKLSEPQSLFNSKEYTLDKMTEKLSTYIEQYIKLPDQVQLKIPDISKISLPFKPKIKQ
jgi:glycosyltransferase involved in cell wall biosynthesis